MAVILAAIVSAAGALLLAYVLLASLMKLLQRGHASN
jgi:phage shock protein PspC (stress-responsive transcriptional regulator)